MVYLFNFSSIFVSCFAVAFRLVGLLSNMSFIFIFVVSSSCIPVHVSRMCSCDSTALCAFTAFSILACISPFTSSILVLTLKMVDASILFNSFIYFGRSPVFQFVFSRRNCIFVFPPLVFCMLCRKYSFSCCGLIYSSLVLCRVSLMCSLILVVVSFHPPVALTFGVNNSTITRLMTRYRETGDVKDHTKSSRPRQTSHQTDNRFSGMAAGAVLTQRMVSADVHNPHLLDQTIRNHLC